MTGYRQHSFLFCRKKKGKWQNFRFRLNYHFKQFIISVRLSFGAVQLADLETGWHHDFWTPSLEHIYCCCALPSDVFTYSRHYPLRTHQATSVNEIAPPCFKTLYAVDTLVIWWGLRKTWWEIERQIECGVCISCVCWSSGLGTEKEIIQHSGWCFWEWYKG